MGRIFIIANRFVKRRLTLNKTILFPMQFCIPNVVNWRKINWSNLHMTLMSQSFIFDKSMEEEDVLNNEFTGFCHSVFQGVGPSPWWDKIRNPLWNISWLPDVHKTFKVSLISPLVKVWQGFIESSLSHQPICHLQSLALKEEIVWISV